VTTCAEVPAVLRAAILNAPPGGPSPSPREQFSPHCCTPWRKAITQRLSAELARHLDAQAQIACPHDPWSRPPPGSMTSQSRNLEGNARAIKALDALLLGADWPKHRAPIASRFPAKRAAACAESRPVGSRAASCARNAKNAVT
jgi:hypothetical protein